MEIKNNKFLIKFLINIYAVGIIGHLIPYTYDLFIYITPAFLWLNFAIAAYIVFKENNIKLIFWSITALIIPFLLEVIGVKTGLLFGSYNYTNILGFRILDVPVVIGLLWFVHLISVAQMTNYTKFNIFIKSIIGAGTSFIFDFLLEPAAIRNNYWNWESNIIPLQNYLMWVLISFTFIYSYIRLNIKFHSKVLFMLIFIQLIYFMLLNIFQ